MTSPSVVPGTVTIATPVYTRLEYLPVVLGSVAQQDYEDIDLLISDNGMNGPELEELVRRHYPGPFRLRRNEETVPMSVHFNQLVECARGEYFVMLHDDDAIAPGFVSSLVRAMEEQPQVDMAVPKVEVMTLEGDVRPRAEAELPPNVQAGEDFVHMWAEGAYNFITFITVMVRTDALRAVGGYPVMVTGDDDAVALKLALDRSVAFVAEALFRHRIHETGAGLAMPPEELADDIRTWLRFLDTDQTLIAYAARHPDRWPSVRTLMRAKAWKTYRSRWTNMYQRRMRKGEWLRAGFAMPWVPEYYRWLASYLLRKGMAVPGRILTRR